MTKDELFSEVRSLEVQAFAMLNSDASQNEFDAVIERTEELTVIAKQKGWL